MEFTFNGGNCITLSTKKATLVIDDNLADLGLKPVANKANISLFTNKELLKNALTGDSFVIDGPGEYEISEISVKGVSARAHMDEEDKKTAAIYRIVVGTTMIAVLGHVYPSITETMLEELGMIDILIVPVGGNGYTLDAVGAEKMIKKIDPKVVIPTHYEEKGVHYEVPQNSLDDFAKQMNVTPEKIDKLKIKNDIFPDTLTVYQLTR